MYLVCGVLIELLGEGAPLQHTEVGQYVVDPPPLLAVALCPALVS